MLTADAVRALMLLLIPLAFWLDFLTPAFLALNAFCISIAATFFNPARDAIIPQITPPQGLLRANSLIQTSWQLALLLGPALAGVLLGLVGKIHIFTINSLSYTLSFLFVWYIHYVSKARTSAEKSPGFQQIVQGLKYIVEHRALFPLLLLTIADNIFIMGPAIVGTPVFVKEVLQRDITAYAIIEFCYAIGMLIGTVILLGLGTRFRKGQALLVGMILDGITFIPLFWVKTIVGAEITIIIHSIAIPFLTVNRASIIQELVPSEMTGRIFASVNIAVVGMSALSAGMTGYILEFTGAPMLFLIIGVGGGLCGVVGWLFSKELVRIK
jgi:MFS family permease